MTWQDARGKDAADVYDRAVAGGRGSKGNEFLVCAGAEGQYTPAMAANAADGMAPSAVLAVTTGPAVHCVYNATNRDLQYACRGGTGHTSICQ